MSYLNDPNGTVRKAKTPSHRRQDGLIKYSYDKTSQSGEDGIIEKLFQLIPSTRDRRYLVDVGAWDGKHLSNSYSLLINENSEWHGVLIEADGEKFQDLVDLHKPYGNTCLNVTVSCMRHSTQSLAYLLRHSTPSVFPDDFEFLCIDVDGTDYWLLHDVLHSQFKPQVICVEFNPTMPHDLIYIQPRDDNIRHGSSLPALVELAEQFDYQLVECTCYNAFLVRRDLYNQYVRDEIPFEPTIDVLHEVTMGTSMYQLYDGTLKIHGCKKMLWHRLPILEEKIQILDKKEDKLFPFAPGAELDQKPVIDEAVANEEKMFQSISVDISSYCTPDGIVEEKQHCSRAVLDQLKADGFALVRGTGIDKDVCNKALAWTHKFLQEAPEVVRRSCLTKDRARRGYSPQNAENFASLIGEQGPNDLVKKFRVGPENEEGDSFALTQPNAWPTEETWGMENVELFQKYIQEYYDYLCKIANSIVQCIADELKSSTSDSTLESSLDALTVDNESHTSILTLLGYKKGARHQGCKKPLVAAHTDVGVITVLLFDAGNSAVLQRAENDTWIDVKLPTQVPNDPIFVVNIGDCLSDLCGNVLPSTLHRVMPRNNKDTIPRNCLALFQGFKSDQKLQINGQSMTYEEWRKNKIAKAQEAQGKI